MLRKTRSNDASKALSETLIHNNQKRVGALKYKEIDQISYTMVKRKSNQDTGRIESNNNRSTLTKNKTFGNGE